MNVAAGRMLAPLRRRDHRTPADGGGWFPPPRRQSSERVARLDEAKQRRLALVVELRGEVRDAYGALVAELGPRPLDGTTERPD